MADYDFTIGNNVARDVDYDIMMGHDVVICTYHDCIMHADVAKTSFIIYYYA